MRWSWPAWPSGMEANASTRRIGVFWPDGRRACYRKLHVAPPERGTLTPGDRVPVFEACGLRFGLQLCYDAHFPELATTMALAGAEAIFLPHASPRGTARAKLASWLRHLTARAFDNGSFRGGLQPGGTERGRARLSRHGGGHRPRRQRDGQKKTVTREALLLADLDAAALRRVRGHRMRYFLPHRRPALYARARLDRGQ